MTMRNSYGHFHHLRTRRKEIDHLIKEFASDSMGPFDSPQIRPKQKRQRTYPWVRDRKSVQFAGSETMRLYA